MDTRVFQELGLSLNEGKIYLALLQYGGSGVSTISLRAQVHRRNAYDAVQRLLEKGLVFEVHGKNETIFEAVDPGKLVELVREKEQNLVSVLPSLQALYHTNRAPELAYIYKGVEGVKNYMREALKCGEDMFILGAEGAWLDPRIASYTAWFLKEARAKKMKISAIFDDDFLQLGQLPSMLADRYKFLPVAYDTNSTMDIFGDYVVTYTGTQPGKLLDNVTIFVMHSPDLAKSYRTWWKCLWDQLPEVAKGRGVQPRELRRLRVKKSALVG